MSGRMAPNLQSTLVLCVVFYSSDKEIDSSTGDHIKWDLRYEQKPICFAVFANNFLSYSLWSPDIAYFLHRRMSCRVSTSRSSRAR